MDEAAARALLKDYFAGGSSDPERAAEIYQENAAVEFPQSGERIRGRDKVVSFRSTYPADVGFEIDRVIGQADLWLVELTVRYDGDNPHKGLGIMELRDGRVARERIYFGEPWEPPAWRAESVELIEPATTYADSGDPFSAAVQPDLPEVDEAIARALIKDHFDWASRDEPRASELYADDAVLEFPQSAERIRSRANIIAFRSVYPAKVTFEMHRTIGRGNLWLNEYTIRYDGQQPHNVAGIMEFRDGQVVRERIYITKPWEPPAWREQWVELMEPTGS